MASETGEGAGTVGGGANRKQCRGSMGQGQG